MQDQKPDPAALARRLSAELDDFVKNYGEQFHITIPGKMLPRIDEYRNQFFPYLKDSEYKSNLCYLLQLIDYQLWNYKLFKPGLSLGNSFFYMLMVTMGIIAEALAVAILLNPVLRSDDKDRSLGKVGVNHQDLKETLDRQPFAANIHLITRLKILPQEQINHYHEIRSNIRNIVHMQNWEGRLYNTLSQELFMERLKIFREFLYGLTASLKIMHTAEELRSALYDNITGTSEIRSYTGVIEKYFDDKGFGFIQAENGKSFFFHFKNCKTKGKIQPGVPVKFSLQPGKKGLEAKEIEIMT